MCRKIRCDGNFENFLVFGSALNENKFVACATTVRTMCEPWSVDLNIGLV